MDSILEILEFAPTIDLTTLDRAKLELNITDNSQDAKLILWIHEASAAINSYVDRILGRETVRETFLLDTMTGTMSPLPLRRYPIAFVDSISSNTQPLTPSDFRFDMFRGLLFRNYGRWCGETVVQYQAGYQLLGELPYDLERACLLLLQYRSSSAAGIRDQSIRAERVPGVYEVDYWVGTVSGSTTGGSLPADVTALLAPYKDIGV